MKIICYIHCYRNSGCSEVLLLPDGNQHGSMAMNCEAGATIVLSHPMMTDATLVGWGKVFSNYIYVYVCKQI